MTLTRLWYTMRILRDRKLSYNEGASKAEASFPLARMP